MKEYRVVVLGSAGVGKTLLILQYLEKTYDPTLEDSYRKETTVPLPHSQLEGITEGFISHAYTILQQPPP